ncbi:unnamed protein product [Camellia sinensis]
MGSCKNQEGNRQNCLWVHGPIIVGAGPSGVAVSACLKNNGVRSLILERSDCIASLWKQRKYDRLKLHLPKQFCELPLFGFLENFPKYPTKHQFISYMESYASHFNIEPSFKQVVKRAELIQLLGFVGFKLKIVSTFPGGLSLPRAKMPSLRYRKFQGLRGLMGLLCIQVCIPPVLISEIRVFWWLVVGILVWRSTMHILPKETFGFSTFGIAMALLKWLPLRLVDKFLLLIANFTLGNTDRLGLGRPKTSPIELKNSTGKTPGIDIGAFSQIKSGKIKVLEGVREITRNGAIFTDGIEKEFDSIIFATGYKSNVPPWLK